MKIFAYSVATPVAAVMAILLIRFGTVSPCEILRKELLTEMLKETNFGSRPDGLAEQFGQSFSLTVVPLMIRNLIDTLSPTQCVSSYYRIRFEGEKLLDTLDWGYRKDKVHSSLARWRKVAQGRSGRRHGCC